MLSVQNTSYYRNWGRGFRGRTKILREVQERPCVLAKFKGKVALRKPIEQALNLASDGKSAAKPAKKSAPKKKAEPKKSAPKKSEAPSGDAAFAKYAVSGSTSGGKFWEVEVVGSDMRIRYGKLGADAKWSTTSFDSEENAIKEATKKFNGKTRKGYVETEKPRAVSASNVALAEAHLLGTFYFRTLDREPGGNIDTTTIKLTYRTEGVGVRWRARFQQACEGQMPEQGCEGRVVLEGLGATIDMDGRAVPAHANALLRWAGQRALKLSFEHPRHEAQLNHSTVVVGPWFLQTPGCASEVLLCGAQVGTTCFGEVDGGAHQLQELPRHLPHRRASKKIEGANSGLSRVRIALTDLQHRAPCTKEPAVEHGAGRVAACDRLGVFFVARLASGVQRDGAKATEDGEALDAKGTHPRSGQCQREGKAIE